MSDEQSSEDLQKFLDVREPGADYEQHAQQGAFTLPIDTENYHKFPRVDDNVTYRKTGKDYRWEMRESKLELPDYSGPIRTDLSFMDFSNDALLDLLWASHDYYVLLVEAWADECESRFGKDEMQLIQSTAWNSGVLAKVPRIVEEWKGFDVTEMPSVGTDSDLVIFSPFKPDARYAECSKERLVKMLLGSHEFLLLVIEAWAAQVVVRVGLDDMFDIQWALWSNKVLPGVRDTKNKWAKVQGGETRPVEAFLKDIQIDATSFPGKAFEMTFEMPEKEVGYMSFLKCCAVDQWEALGRPDILEKNCHSTCPKSMIETAKLYDPNMKIDILAIPPRKSADSVCCKWKLSIRDKSDPEYVEVAGK
jgi:hypothetical protein